MTELFTRLKKMGNSENVLLRRLHTYSLLTIKTFSLTQLRSQPHVTFNICVFYLDKRSDTTYKTPSTGVLFILRRT